MRNKEAFLEVMDTDTLAESSRRRRSQPLREKPRKLAISDAKSVLKEVVSRIRNHKKHQEFLTLNEVNGIIKIIKSLTFNNTRQSKVVDRSLIELNLIKKHLQNFNELFVRNAEAQDESFSLLGFKKKDVYEQLKEPFSIPTKMPSQLQNLPLKFNSNFEINNFVSFPLSILTNDNFTGTTQNADVENNLDTDCHKDNSSTNYTVTSESILSVEEQKNQKVLEDEAEAACEIPSQMSFLSEKYREINEDSENTNDLKDQNDTINASSENSADDPSIQNSAGTQPEMLFSTQEADEVFKIPSRITSLRHEHAKEMLTLMENIKINEDSQETIDIPMEMLTNNNFNIDPIADTILTNHSVSSRSSLSADHLQFQKVTSEILFPTQEVEAVFKIPSQTCFEEKHLRINNKSVEETLILNDAYDSNDAPLKPDDLYVGEFVASKSRFFPDTPEIPEDKLCVSNGQSPKESENSFLAQESAQIFVFNMDKHQQNNKVQNKIPPSPYPTEFGDCDPERKVTNSSDEYLAINCSDTQNDEVQKSTSYTNDEVIGVSQNISEEFLILPTHPAKNKVMLKNISQDDEFQQYTFPTYVYPTDSSKIKQRNFTYNDTNKSHNNANYTSEIPQSKAICKTYKNISQNNKRPIKHMASLIQYPFENRCKFLLTPQGHAVPETSKNISQKKTVKENVPQNNYHVNDILQTQFLPEYNSVICQFIDSKLSQISDIQQKILSPKTSASSGFSDCIEKQLSQKCGMQRNTISPTVYSESKNYSQNINTVPQTEYSEYSTEMSQIINDAKAKISSTLRRNISQNDSSEDITQLIMDAKTKISYAQKNIIPQTQYAMKVSSESEIPETQVVRKRSFISEEKYADYSGIPSKRPGILSDKREQISGEGDKKMIRILSHTTIYPKAARFKTNSSNEVVIDGKTANNYNSELSSQQTESFQKKTLLETESSDKLLVNGEVVGQSDIGATCRNQLLPSCSQMSCGADFQTLPDNLVMNASGDKNYSIWGHLLKPYTSQTSCSSDMDIKKARKVRLKVVEKLGISIFGDSVQILTDPEYQKTPTKIYNCEEICEDIRKMEESIKSAKAIIKTEFEAYLRRKKEEAEQVQEEESDIDSDEDDREYQIKLCVKQAEKGRKILMQKYPRKELKEEWRRQQEEEESDEELDVTRRRSRDISWQDLERMCKEEEAERKNKTSKEKDGSCSQNC